MQWTNLQSWTNIPTSAPDSPQSPKLLEALAYARDLNDERLRCLIVDLNRESFLRGLTLGTAKNP